MAIFNFSFLFFADLKHTSLDRKKSEEVDAALVVMKCEGKKSVEKVREKTPCSREKSKKSKKRETFDGDRPDTISTIDLQVSRLRDIFSVTVL